MFYKNYKINIWDILFHLSMLVLTIWLILKITGVINSPVIIQYGIPIGSLIIGGLSLYHNLIKNINELAFNLAILTVKVGGIEKDVEILKDNDKKIETKINHIDKDIEILKIDVSTLKSDVIILKQRI